MRFVHALVCFVCKNMFLFCPISVTQMQFNGKVALVLCIFVQTKAPTFKINVNKLLSVCEKRHENLSENISLRRMK